jgi:hypothetical protein
MITNSMINDNLVTVDFLRLNTVLVRMVRQGKLTNSEREDLLHKAGLLKLENGKWRENDTTILSLVNE